MAPTQGIRTWPQTTGIDFKPARWWISSKRPGGGVETGIRWVKKEDHGPHEANFLKLDCSKLKATFGWKPRWKLDKAVEKVVEWSKCWLEGGDVKNCMDQEIEEFLSA